MLSYVRSGPRSSTPTVVIPGGPGLGSIRPYMRFRRQASSGGLDLIMIEHRGVGYSRLDSNGHRLPQSAMWVTDVVDDIAAVLDHEGVDRAYIAGSSYGSYLASAFGTRHPDRVAGMLLDSALQSADDVAVERAHLRELLWDADTPSARQVRALSAQQISDRELIDVVRAAYELGGETLLDPVVNVRTRRRFSPTWMALALYAGRDESIARIPGHYEFDIAGTIGFRELGYGGVPDGHPLDPAHTYAPIANRFPGFAGEPYDLHNEVTRFSWPVVLLSGSRDIRTPPRIADRLADTIPDATLVRIINGHSALDTHPAAFLNAVRHLVRGSQERLPGLASRLDALPRRGIASRFARVLGVTSRIEQALTARSS
ncbi:MAG: alpha/beta fold hydrolase [Mycetocola sp.]